MVSWAFLELIGAEFNDNRLRNRLITIVDAFARQPEASVPQACGGASEAKAAYRFLDNQKVTPEAILAPHVKWTRERAKECSVVLAVQDTTEIDLTSHPATQGTGYLGSSHCRGILLHSVLAVSPTGVPLGLLHQQMWTRPLEELGKAKARRKKTVAAKESQRWLSGLSATEEALADHPRVVLVGDRESDLYDLFAAPRRANVDLLVRVCRENRCVDHPAHSLKEAVLASPVQGTTTVELLRSGDRAARRATLSVRWLSVKILPPRNHLQHKQLEPILLHFVAVEELNPPPGEKPVRWLLATTLPVTCLQEAIQCVQWYVYRWRIERFHYVLKSGCRIEQRELETVRRMQNAIATYSIVAWRVLWLTYQARENPDVSCEIALDRDEWRALHATVHRKQAIPQTPPSLREAVRMIARLGGFLGRKRDGEPGVKTLWKGLIRLHDITETWKLCNPSSRRLLVHATCG